MQLALATPPYALSVGNTAVCNPLWQHRRMQLALATPPYAISFGNTAVCNQLWQRRRMQLALHNCCSIEKSLKESFIKNKGCCWRNKIIFRNFVATESTETHTFLGCSKT
jgi:hypothetical protein